MALESLKLYILYSLARILRLPSVRGKVTISEAVYRLLAPKTTVVEMRVCGRPILLDLAEPELRYIFFGAFEPSEVRFIDRYLRAGDLTIDVGANVGYLSALMLCRVGSNGKVFAFEPNSALNGQLLRLAEVSAGSLEVYRMAVTNRTSASEIDGVNLFVDTQHSMWSSTKAEIVGPQQVVQRVATIRLSDFIGTERIEEVEFIKIDVEGGEAEVLEGLLPLVDQGFKPTILCEVTPHGPHWNSTVEHTEKLVAAGYAIWKLTKGGEPVQITTDHLNAFSDTGNIVFSTAENMQKRLVSEA